jgi:imidazolonepropionase-like amidohydrolase
MRLIKGVPPVPSAARLLRTEGRVGTLDVGAFADVLLVERDPLQESVDQTAVIRKT